MEGWVLYKRPMSELNGTDHGVTRLLEAASQKGLNLKVFTPDQLDVSVSQVHSKTVMLDASCTTLPDFVIPRVGANVSYAALALLRQFEQQGVYVCNRSRTIELAKDKLVMMQMLAYAHLPTPKTLLMKFPMSTDWIKREIGFPLVMKMISGAKGFGVHLCRTPSALEEIMEIISSQLTHTPIILQEFIESSYGQDLRVLVLGGEVIGCMKRVSAGESFKANYSRGGRVETFRLTPEIERLAIETTQLFNLEFAGIDLLFDGNGFKVCEANSSPGFKGIEEVYDIDVAGKVLDYIVGQISGTKS